MKGKQESAPEGRPIKISLKDSDLQILDNYRGELSRDAFLSILLQMVESGAVSKTPDWIKKKKKQ